MSRERSSSPIPLDIIGVIAATVVAYLATGLPPGAPIRVGIGVAYLLFVPGYVLTTAVFPAKPPADARGYGNPLGPASVKTIDGTERLALSFGLSLVLLPLLGLVLAALPWPFNRLNVLAVTTAFVAVALLVGLFRRARLAEDIRYDAPFRSWGTRAHHVLFRTPTIDGVLNIVLAVVVIAAAGSMAFALAAPADGSTYSSVTLLTRDEGGDLVAADYPTEFSQGSGQNLALVVENHEGESVRYVVVVQLQRVDGGRVTETAELDRYAKQVPAQGTWRIRHTVTPTMAGEDLRLVYLVYTESAPGSPGIDNAYRHVSLWIDVSG